MRSISRLVFVIAAGALAACGSGSGSGGGQDGGATDVAPRSFSGRPIDVVILVDDSLSMGEEQMRLGSAFPAFVAALEHKYGAALDLHVGVISSDLGALPGGDICGRPLGNRGALQVKTGCDLDVTQGRFIAHTPSGSNYKGSLAPVLECMVRLGVSGCGFEHQLQALAVALNGPPPTENEGFLRQDAGLMILILSDEDDCSAAPGSEFFTSPDYPGTAGSLRCAIDGHTCDGKSPLEMKPFEVPLSQCTATKAPKHLLAVDHIAEQIKASKPNAPIAVGVLGGFPLNADQATYGFHLVKGPPDMPGILDPNPICTSDIGVATVGLRLRQFAEFFGGTTYSICSPDYGEALTDVVNRLP